MLDLSKPIRGRLIDHLKHLDHYLHSTTPHRHTLLRYRGLFQGVSFALLIQVPALAFFLSTYDATKHTLAHIAHSLHLPFFHLHHAETHLASGAMAKIAGTVLWAPQQLLQGMHKGQGQLSIRDAALLAKNLCKEQGATALWTGYQRSLMVLLPYTAVYFAVYEKLKQLARQHLFDAMDGKADPEEVLYPTALQGFTGDTSARQGSVLQPTETTPTPLNLGTYMICVAGAVAVSATICHTASTIRGHVMQQKSSAPTASSPVPATAHTSRLMLAQTISTSTAATPIHLASTHRQHQAHLTTSTTTSVKEATTLRLQMKQEQIASLDTASSKRVAKLQRGFLRSLTRGLGPRIMWTAPGVTLTTAGFEVFRNMALGVA